MHMGTHRGFTLKLFKKSYDALEASNTEKRCVNNAQGGLMRMGALMIITIIIGLLGLIAATLLIVLYDDTKELAIDIATMALIALIVGIFGIIFYDDMVDNEKETLSPLEQEELTQP